VPTSSDWRGLRLLHKTVAIAKPKHAPDADHATLLRGIAKPARIRPQPKIFIR
jgi:hypothetical protein